MIKKYNLKSFFKFKKSNPKLKSFYIKNKNYNKKVNNILEGMVDNWTLSKPKNNTKKQENFKASRNLSLNNIADINDLNILNKGIKKYHNSSLYEFQKLDNFKIKDPFNLFNSKNKSKYKVKDPLRIKNNKVNFDLKLIMKNLKNLKLPFKEVYNKRLLEKRPYKYGIISKLFFNYIKNNNLIKLTDICDNYKYIVYDIDNKFQSGIHWSVKRNLYTITEFLINRNSNLYFKDMMGRIPFEIAIYNNDIKMIKLFIDKGFKLEFSIYRKNKYKIKQNVKLFLENFFKSN